MNGTTALAYGIHQPPHANPGDTLDNPLTLAWRVVRSDQMHSTMLAASVSSSARPAIPPTKSSASSTAEMDPEPSTALSKAALRTAKATARTANAPAAHQNRMTVAVRNPRVSVGEDDAVALPTWGPPWGWALAGGGGGALAGPDGGGGNDGRSPPEGGGGGGV